MDGKYSGLSLAAQKWQAAVAAIHAEVFVRMWMGGKGLDLSLGAQKR